VKDLLLRSKINLFYKPWISGETFSDILIDNNDIKAENRDIKAENRDIKAENRDIKAENRDIKAELALLRKLIEDQRRNT
jgi:cell division protein FtsB